MGYSDDPEIIAMIELMKAFKTDNFKQI